MENYCNKPGQQGYVQFTYNDTLDMSLNKLVYSNRPSNNDHDRRKELQKTYSLPRRANEISEPKYFVSKHHGICTR